MKTWDEHGWRIIMYKNMRSVNYFHQTFLLNTISTFH